MSFHTIAWSEDLGIATDANVQPVPDRIITIQNDRFLPQSDWDVLYVSVFGPDVDFARLVTPKLRQFSPVQLRDLNVAGTIQDNPAVVDYRDFPLRLERLEEISLEVSNSPAVPPSPVLGMMGMTRSPVSLPQGDIFTIRGTDTVTTGVADEWSLLNVTFADTLPNGRYAAVGLQVLSTAAFAARLIFDDFVERPGAMGGDGFGLIGSPIFRRGNLGEWGQFDANRMPDVEVFSNVATANFDIFLDFMRIR